MARDCGGGVSARGAVACRVSATALGGGGGGGVSLIGPLGACGICVRAGARTLGLARGVGGAV